MELVIRDASACDAHSIAELEKETSAHPWSEDSIIHDITDNERAIVIAAFLGDRLSGYADVWSIAGEGQLNNIAVTGSARGRHIGQRLMEELFLRPVSYTHLTLPTKA